MSPLHGSCLRSEVQCGDEGTRTQPGGIVQSSYLLGLLGGAQTAPWMGSEGWVSHWGPVLIIWSLLNLVTPQSPTIIRRHQATPSIAQEQDERFSSQIHSFLVPCPEAGQTLLQIRR